jgi:hypothetical protein
MQTQEVVYIAWGLLAAFLLLGLFLYERTGMRLGGVLVLPLLLVYAIFDVNIVAVFAVASAFTLVVGQIVHSQTFLYGRRLLYAFILIGMAATVAALHYVTVAVAGVILALLPGIFAYNLHREGRYLEGASAFAMWFGIMLMAAVAALWLIAQPQLINDALTTMGDRFTGGQGTAALADGTTMDLMPATVTAVAAFEALRDSGAAE